MEQYQRVVVCIDRPERDAPVLSYTQALARQSRSKEIHVLHVAPEDAPIAKEPVDETSLRKLARSHFDEPGLPQCQCHVVRGSPVLEILKFSLESDADLIVVGRHYGEAGDSTDDAALARRITRKSTCSVLVMPEQFERRAQSILVPVRYSDCSSNALEVACAVASVTGGKVIALNVFQVHAGYSRVGATRDEHETMLFEAADRECADLVARTDTRGVEIECQCAPDPAEKPVSVILEAIGIEATDLVVIGARGRSGAAGVLLGKVTEQLILKCPVPVLAVKKKGECIGVLKALLTFAGQGE